MRRLAAGLVLMTLAPDAPAQDAHAGAPSEVAASAPVDRSITVYRAPWRNGGGMALARLGGFAVITEERYVILPAGRARLRFEGVADGILPESAILAGLPEGVIEKNQDAALLSPSSLLRATVGRQVELRRTNPATGKTSILAARLVSASEDGVVFATDQGNESLRCSGLPETFTVSTSATSGLSNQPTLSVLTHASAPRRVRISLTYIAEQFDWSANYIAHIAKDGKVLNLTGWITLANGNSVSLPRAQTQIVAGGLNRAYVARFVNQRPRVVARCWAMQTTSDIPERAGQPYRLVQPWQKPREEVMVTARRAIPPPPPPVMMTAPAAITPMAAPKAEQLGDLKLYRVPERTTIAARQMKQTRLIDQSGVGFETIYRAEVGLAPWMGEGSTTATTLLRSRNDKAHQLGLPLPAGSVLVQQDQGGQVMMLGEASLRDTADGEKLELAIGRAPDISVTWRRKTSPASGQTWVITLANASPRAAAVELRLPVYGGSIASISATATKVDGVQTVPWPLASGESRQLEVRLAR